MATTDLILDIFDSYGDLPAIIWNEIGLSYRDFVCSINYWKRFCSAERILPNECIAFCGDFSPATAALLFVLINNRNIIVPLTPSTKSHQSSLLDIACASKIIEFDSQENGHLKNLTYGKPHPLFQKISDLNDAGLVLFSSGSTGKIKASLLKFKDILSKHIGMRRSYRTITFLLLDHIGGINTLLSVLLNGGTIVVPNDRKPDTICSLIQKYKVELLPTSPTFLNMLLISKAYERFDLSSLKMITYGTEPMPSMTLKTLNKVLPNIRFKQTYGMTETGILPTMSEQNDSTWMKIGGNEDEIKVIDNKLWIRTSSAMVGYLNESSPFNEEGWLDTGDLVEVKNEYFRILGRVTEIINVGGIKVYPMEVENIILQAPNIKNVLVKGKQNHLTGNVVVAEVELCQPEDNADLSKRIRKFCLERMETYKVPSVITISPLPLHNERFKKVRMKQPSDNIGII